MAFCSPSGVPDKRVMLLKQAATTGMPARSKSRSQSSSAARSKDDSDLLKLPLAVDITTLPDDDPNEEPNNEADHLSSEANEATSHIGYFTRRAFVAQGNYRTGWVLDEERASCAECRRAFGTVRRKHHCRGCGEVFCDFCTSQRSAVPHLEGARHRVCRPCCVQMRRTAQDPRPSSSSTLNSLAGPLPAPTLAVPSPQPLPPPAPLVEEDAAASSNGSAAWQRSADGEREVYGVNANAGAASGSAPKHEMHESNNSAGVPPL